MKALLLFAMLMSCVMPSNAGATSTPPISSPLCQYVGCAFIPNASCQCDDWCPERVPPDCCFDFYQFCEEPEMALTLIMLLVIGGVVGVAACAFWQWSAYKRRRTGRRGTSDETSGAMGVLTGRRMRSSMVERDVPPAYSKYPGHVVNPVFNPDIGEGDSLFEPWSESPN